MLRSGFFLGIAGPAALLTLMVQPLVRDGVDAAGRNASLQRIVVGEGVGSAPKTSDFFTVASVTRSERRSPDETAKSPSQASRDKATSKMPRRLMKEGCEGAISSLAGPEARRMLPGRCIA